MTGPPAARPSAAASSLAARLLVTYALALAGGLAARALHSPLPWLLGPLFATGAASLAGTPRPVLPASRQAGQAVIGAALGLYFTREVLAALAGALPWMLAAAAATMATGVAGARLLARRAGVSPATAFFACVPGGAAEMAVLGERAGADSSVVAVAHAIRVVAVVTVVPLALSLAGARCGDAWAQAPLGITAGGLARLAGGSVAAGLLAQLLRLPNAWLLGPLAASGVMTAGGLAGSAVPRAVVDAGQLFLGCALGSRFARESFRSAGVLAGAIVLATAQGMAALALFAVALAFASELSPWTLLLATAPGGIAEMCLTARTLQLGVPVVTAFHVLRLVVILTLAPLAFRAWQRPTAGAPPPPSRPDPSSR